MFFVRFICITSLPEVIANSSLPVNTMPLCGYGATCIWNWRQFIIQLIPDSPSPPSACRLESLGMRQVREKS